HGRSPAKDLADRHRPRRQARPTRTQTRARRSRETELWFSLLPPLFGRLAVLRAEVGGGGNVYNEAVEKQIVYQPWSIRRLYWTASPACRSSSRSSPITALPSPRANWGCRGPGESNRSAPVCSTATRAA